MKALCVKQPWAWAIVNGHKPIETRTWITRYRGPLVIVASRSPDRSMDEYRLKIPTDQMDYGKAVGIVHLAECRLMRPSDAEAAMCELYDRACAWVFRDIRKIAPFPVRGQLGLFEIPDHLLHSVKPDAARPIDPKLDGDRPYGGSLGGYATLNFNH
jgi:hypothetical protein